MAKGLVSLRPFRVFSALMGAEDGITVARDGQPVTFQTGFIVGGVKPSLIVPAEAGIATPDVMGDFEDWLPQDAALFGAWVNDGLRHIDAVEWVPFRDQALALARLRGELAIWDNANQVEIATR